MLSDILRLLLASHIFNAGEAWLWIPDNMRNWDEVGGTFIGTAPACSGHSSDCLPSFFWYSVTSGDGDYCSSGRKVYCNNYASPYRNQWWSGTAPYCAGRCGDCGSSVCIAEDGSGDGNFCGSAGHKVMCVTYPSRRLEEYETNYTENVKIVQEGVNIGFYLYLGDDFDDDLLFETRAYLDEFITSVSSALSSLVPNVTTTADIGRIHGHGYAEPSSQIGGLLRAVFVNASLVPFINVKFKYTTQADAISIESYLDDSNNEDAFNAAVQTEVAQSVYSDLPSSAEIHFVEANRYVTQIETKCSVGNSNESYAFKVFDAKKVLLFQVFVFVFFLR